MSYQNLKTISNVNDVIQNVDQTLNDMDNRGLCLTILRQSNAGVDKTPPFALQYNNCSVNKSVICRLSMQEKGSPRKPPRFPCLSIAKRARKKRKIKDSGKSHYGRETRPRNNEGTAYFDFGFFLLWKFKFSLHSSIPWLINVVHCAF